MNKTKIPYCDYTWNPYTGCTPCSPGCDNCYSQNILRRFKKPQTPMFHPERINDPLKVINPSTIFVGSMTDMFHSEINPDPVFDVIGKTPNHTYLILTKRAINMEDYLRSHSLSRYRNVFFGVTAENQYYADQRIEDLVSIEGINRWVSVEPLLGPIEIRPHLMRGLDWVVVGGESGPKARPCCVEWIENISTACENAGVPYYFKQWGAKTDKNATNISDNITRREPYLPLEKG